MNIVNPEGDAGHQGEAIEALVADDAEPFDNLCNTLKKRKHIELYIPDHAVIQPQVAAVEDEDINVQDI